MAERKSGPVKPPVIDLTARPPEPQTTETASPAASGSTSSGAAEKPVEAARKPAPEPSSAAPAGAPKPPADKRRAPRGSAGAPAAVGAIGGAVIGIAISYALASAGYWPSPTTNADIRMAQLQDRLDQAEKTASANATVLAGFNTQLGGLQNDVTTRLGAASDALKQVQQSVATLQAAKPPAVDLAPLEAQVKTLSARVDAVAAGASSADAGALAANLATVQQNLAGLTNRVAAVDAHLTATDGTVSGLKTKLDSARSAIDQAAKAPSPKTIASAMQLPLLISALEADFAAGRPYAADLASLTAAVPEAHVPASVSDAAAAGLPAPGDLARQLEARMPDILDARPAGTDSSWQGQLGDWVKRTLALRPQGELQGDSPEAVASRLQQAVDRHDFGAAATLFGQLPQPMQQAAGDLGTRLKALADADAFLAGLRQTALAPAAGAQQ